MSVPSLKELVAPNQQAEFQFCNGGYLWYDVAGVTFPIPLDDVKGGNFNRSMRSIELMRWIRKHLINLEKAREA